MASRVSRATIVDTVTAKHACDHCLAPEGEPCIKRDGTLLVEDLGGGRLVRDVHDARLVADSDAQHRGPAALREMADRIAARAERATGRERVRQRAITSVARRLADLLDAPTDERPMPTIMHLSLHLGKHLGELQGHIEDIDHTENPAKVARGAAGLQAWRHRRIADMRAALDLLDALIPDQESSP